MYVTPFLAMRPFFSVLTLLSSRADTPMQVLLHMHFVNRHVGRPQGARLRTRLSLCMHRRVGGALAHLSPLPPQGSRGVNQDGEPPHVWGHAACAQPEQTLCFSLRKNKEEMFPSSFAGKCFKNVHNFFRKQDAQPTIIASSRATNSWPRAFG
ncbi:hypothetical protein TW95_gp0673 [Pandoravirus inopinatum]|uniref:Uncharacterized protein n=1 Tax=Pandoravirus inopinatum TaxID=1605721 RepID=A0A0B5JCN0_9VIRU|nr:hypothetical protein TW95_gp0673 [Pandoravirus inopinatum]AJF97407.1 hypothetical protein [Pandoravirus inopinatum]